MLWIKPSTSKPSHIQVLLFHSSLIFCAIYSVMFYAHLSYNMVLYLYELIVLPDYPDLIPFNIDRS
jgi:hypothetical protein